MTAAPAATVPTPAFLINSRLFMAIPSSDWLKLTFRTPLNTYLVNFLDHFMAQQNFQEKHPELLSIHAAPVLKGGQAVCPCYFLQQEQKQIL